MSFGIEKLEKTQSKIKPNSIWFALLLFACLVLVACVIAYAFDFPFSLPTQKEFLSRLRALVLKLHSFGAYGVVFIIILYAFGVVVAAPSALMTFAVTLVYGFSAIAITYIGALLGLLFAFLTARALFGHQIAWFCDRYPVTRGIEKALQDNGFWIIFLLRQSPIVPFAIQNYMFGVLGVPTLRYLYSSALGIIPGTIAKVYIFETAKRAAQDPSGHIYTYILGAAGVMATIIVMWLVGRFVAGELKATKESIL